MGALAYGYGASERRSGTMAETREPYGTSTASTTGAAAGGPPPQTETTSAAPVPAPIPLVTYTKFPNIFLDMRPRLSMPGERLVGYLVRRTAGWHQDATELTDAELMRETELSEAAVKRARHELVSRRVLTYAPGVGRGKPGRYTLTPLATIEGLEKGSGENPFIDEREKGPQVDPYSPEKGSGYSTKPSAPEVGTAPDAMGAGGTSEPRISTNMKENTYKEKRSASRSAMTPPASPEQTTQKRVPKVSPEEAQYRRQLVEACEAMMTRWHRSTDEAAEPFRFANQAKERDGAKWFYTAGPNRTPVDIVDVAKCFAFTLLEPFWDRTPLGLHKLQGQYTLYARNPHKYAVDMKAARARIEAATTRATNPPQTSAAASSVPRITRARSRSVWDEED